MSRQPGAPNKPKVIEEKLDTYIILSDTASAHLCEDVAQKIKQGYECLGGIAIANYRGDDGRIVFVYKQAMVKKEM